MPASPALPPLRQSALLLDLDGTLLDIAPTPDSVHVPASLIRDLARLRDRLGGALAVISGRPVEQVDALLAGTPTAISGEHGGALRASPGGAIERPDLPGPPPAWIEAAETLVALHPGALLERKARGFVAHYRRAPDAGPALRTALAALIAPREKEFLLLRAHMAWEVRPAGTDKGTALRALMARAPFAGRRPIFIGDDVTDEDAIAAAIALTGTGLRLPEHFATPANVRAWISAATTSPDWPAPDKHGKFS